MADSYAPIKEWIPVSSSNLGAIWYDAEEEILKVEFSGAKGSGVRYYGYSGVPMSVFLALLSAGSKGKYFAKHVRMEYPYAPLGYGGV